jgi:hypothetical protein
MKNNISLSTRKVLLLSASFFTLFLSACKKEGSLSPDFIENTSSSSFSDTLAIRTQTVAGRAVLADKIATALSGIYQDSVFGKVSSSFYTQPLLPGNALVFGNTGETLITDSVVLSLEYSGFYGDSSIQQTLEVFRLSENVDLDESYFSDTSIQHESSPLGSLSFRPRPNTPVTILQPNTLGGIDTVELDAQLRIRLDNAFGDELLSKSGQDELANNTNFTDFFKGIKVSPVDMGGLSDNQAAILYIALTASQTRISLYYKKVSSTNDTTRSVTNFPINSSSVRFNTFSHDYSSGEVASVLGDTNTQYVYTESMAGVETNIKFPGVLKALKGQKIILNKAELELPVSNVLAFGTAEKLILASRDNVGDLQFIPDFFESESYFGGKYDGTDQLYRFNITRYIQGLLNGTENDNGLTVLVTGSAVKAERAIFQDDISLGRRIKLNLYYSNTQ